MSPLVDLYESDGILRAYCDGLSLNIEKALIYTDGSHTPLGSSWVAVILVRFYGLEGSKVLARVGHFGGLVSRILSV